MSRSYGLDTLRAAAIGLVFMYHYGAFISGEATFGWGSVLGWTGVDLFFVLSGYLIANQLFVGIARGQALSPQAFYLRRALRTLPAFWVVLALYFAVPAFMGAGPLPPLWKFVTFTQNLGLKPGTGFSHAWSLCVEEQFYLVLPMVLVLGARFSLSRGWGWVLILCLLLVGIGARSVLWLSGVLHEPTYHTRIYYATLCRFDEFLPGIAVAMLKNFQRPLWERITRYGHWSFAGGVLATGTMFWLMDRYYAVEGYGYTFWLTAVGYSLLAMSFALLVIASLSRDSWLHRVRIPGAYHLALWSYSIYLSHRAVAAIMARALEPLPLWPGVMPALIAVGSVLIGALLYWLVESRFMALRDRWFPTSFKGVPGHRGHDSLPVAL